MQYAADAIRGKSAGENSQELVKGVEALVRSMESGNEENVRGIRAD